MQILWNLIQKKSPRMRKLKEPMITKCLGVMLESWLLNRVKNIRVCVCQQDNRNQPNNRYQNSRKR